MHVNYVKNINNREAYLGIRIKRNMLQFLLVLDHMLTEQISNTEFCILKHLKDLHAHKTWTLSAVCL